MVAVDFSPRRGDRRRSRVAGWSPRFSVSPGQAEACTPAFQASLRDAPAPARLVRGLKSTATVMSRSATVQKLICARSCPRPQGFASPRPSALQSLKVFACRKDFPRGLKPPRREEPQRGKASPQKSAVRKMEAGKWTHVPDPIFLTSLFGCGSAALRASRLCG